MEKLKRFLTEIKVFLNLETKGNNSIALFFDFPQKVYQIKTYLAKWFGKLKK